MFERQDLDLSGAASRGTMARWAEFAGWALLLALAATTAVHAVTLVMTWTGASTNGGGVLNFVRLAGVALVELFAVMTAAMLATRKLRAAQKPIALALELVYFGFAALNLIGTFAVEHGGQLPRFLEIWIAYGLPVSALVVGGLFYAMLRADPAAKRADDEAEAAELFQRQQHAALLEVVASPQLAAVVRQAAWQRLPAVIGSNLNLNDEQIALLVRQAPKPLDLSDGDHAETTMPRPAVPTPMPMPTVERAVAYSNGTGVSDRPF